MAIIQPFHIQLNSLLSFNNYSCEEAVKLIKIKKNINISSRSMRLYVRGEMVPDYIKARDILESFDVKTDEMELQKALSMTKDERYIKQMDKYDINSIRKTIRIKLKGMFTDLTPEEANILLTERVNQLFGNSDDISSYVNYLIKKDLEYYLDHK